ncbi:hypothetical protein LTR67_000597 [Exophiala xenobiotica]
MASTTGTNEPYICKTQDGFMPTFGHLPLSATTGGSSQPPGTHPIMTSTFDNKDNADLATKLLQQAGKLWNSCGCGVTFTATTDPKKAHFDVVYNKNGNDGATAMAFFPNNIDKVYIYPEAFNDPSTKSQLLNTFTHELGHVLGLRHEHAAAEGGAVQIGEMNPNSIMSYNRETRSLQQSDRSGLLKIYGYNNGDKIDKVPVTDFVPVFLKRA